MPAEAERHVHRFTGHPTMTSRRCPSCGRPSAFREYACAMCDFTLLMPNEPAQVCRGY